MLDIVAVWPSDHALRCRIVTSSRFHVERINNLWLRASGKPQKSVIGGCTVRPLNIEVHLRRSRQCMETRWQKRSQVPDDQATCSSAVKGSAQRFWKRAVAINQSAGNRTSLILLGAA